MRGFVIQGGKILVLKENEGCILASHKRIAILIFCPFYIVENYL